MADIKKTINISDQQIKRYYDENQSNYYTPAQWKVAHILFAVSPEASLDDQQRIKKNSEDTYLSLQKDPGQFDNDVMTISDDKISVEKKGVLPWIVAGQSEFDKALVNLTQAGQISAPIKSQHGYELFKLIAYKPARVKPLPDVKTDIQQQLLADSAQTEYAKTLETLSDLSYQTPDSLAPVAEALKLKLEKSPLFSRKAGDSELTKNKQVVNAAFSHDVLVLGNNSDPVQLDNESVIVLRVSQHVPATEKPLTEVEPLIRDKLAMTKAKAQANLLGKELLKNNQQAIQENKLIKDNKLQWQVVKDATRDTEATHAIINDLAFSLARAGAEGGRSLESGDYVIVRLKDINDGQLSTLDKEQVASITQQIEANYGMMDYDLYVNNLRNKAIIAKF